MCSRYLGNRKIIKTSKRVRWPESVRPSSHLVLHLGAPGMGGAPEALVSPQTPLATGKRHWGSGDLRAQGHVVGRSRGEASEGPSGTNGASEKVSMLPGILLLVKGWGHEWACSRFCLSSTGEPKSPLSTESRRLPSACSLVRRE